MRHKPLAGEQSETRGANMAQQGKQERERQRSAISDYRLHREPTTLQAKKNANIRR